MKPNNFPKCVQTTHKLTYTVCNTYLWRFIHSKVCRGCKASKGISSNSLKLKSSDFSTVVMTLQGKTRNELFICSYICMHVHTYRIGEEFLYRGQNGSLGKIRKLFARNTYKNLTAVQNLNAHSIYNEGDFYIFNRLRPARG